MLIICILTNILTQINRRDSAETIIRGCSSEKLPLKVQKFYRKILMVDDCNFWEKLL